MDLDDLVNIEQRFYDEGYAEGLEHGRSHGLAEGRAMGQKVGYELWEEIGFYEGFARVWKRLAEKELSKSQSHGEGVVSSLKVKDERIVNAAQVLLELIAQFPTVNPSTLSASVALSDPENLSPSSETVNHKYDPEMDVVKVLGQIRSKYKMLCSLVGVKPSLRASQISTTASSATIDDGDSQDGILLESITSSQTKETGSPKRNAGKLWHVDRDSSARKDPPHRQNKIGSLDF